MRAVAVGMSQTKGLPRCPRDCGGPLGASYPEALTPAQKSQRKLFGCDKRAAAPQYMITCPRCDGSRIDPDGKRCGRCENGEVRIFRCPTSHITNEISVALRHYDHAEAGIFPAPGGLLDQSPSFIHFCQTLSGEVNRVQRDEADEREAKAKAERAAAKVRRK